MDCIFCKIRDGIIKSEKIYEDDLFFIINDIHPKAKIHLLAIPKEHYISICDADEKQIEQIGIIMGRVAQMKNQLGLVDGYRIQINQGKNGRQTAEHLLIHFLGGEKLPDWVKIVLTRNFL